MARTLLGITLTASILGGSCWAMGSDGRFTILGEGANSCGTWLQERRAGRWLPMASWVLGYLTAYNQMVWKGGSNIAAGTDTDGIEAWLDAYCRQHPLDNISAATEALTIDFVRRRSR
jgi:hypothetical protein